MFLFEEAGKYLITIMAIVVRLRNNLIIINTVILLTNSKLNKNVWAIPAAQSINRDASNPLTGPCLLFLKRDIRASPQVRVVRINPAGVNKLFHDFTAGNIYSLIILQIKSSENTAAMNPVTFDANLFHLQSMLIRYKISEKPVQHRKSTSRLSQLDFRLFSALTAFNGFPRCKKAMQSEMKKRDSVVSTNLFCCSLSGTMLLVVINI
jgi:hypothetical protein